MSAQNGEPSVDAGADSLAELAAKLERKNEEIKIIQQISAEVIATLELDEILEVSLKTMEAALEFQRCMILLAAPSGESLELAASRGYEASGLGAEVKIGQGVIGVAAKRQRIMRMGNIQSQLTYLSAVRSRMQASGQSEGVEDVVALPGLANAQSQIAIPLVIRDRLVGVFAVESDRPSAFDELDEFLLSIVANQVAGAIDNARLRDQEVERTAELDRAVGQLSSLNETLESKVEERTADLSSALSEVKREKELSETLLNRMAPPEVIPLMLEEKLAAGRLTTTVLFSDLVGFTEFSSGMEPDEIFSRLNHFFSWSGEIINRYRGYVNKTNGDGVMALFGVPFENASHACDAILSALNLQRDLRRQFPLSMRIGINTGVITAGMLGPKNKSLYDVLGDPVNIASRMESICPSGSITISAATHEIVKPYFEIEAMGEQEAKGLRPVDCFKVLGIQKLSEDARRIDPTSAFHAECLAVVDEVNRFKVEHFSMVDFLSIQSRDGAIRHNEAVAAFALALLRSSRASGAAGPDLEGVDEATLIRAALLHDVGKHTVTVERLNDRAPSSEERERLRDDLLAATLETLERLGASDAAPLIEGLTRFERSGGEDGEFDAAVEILAAADIYDAVTTPKFYKGTSWRITGALEELLHLPYCQRAARPVFQAFVTLMKPAEAAISVQPTTKVIIQ